MKTVAGVSSCEVQCPQCPSKMLLSAYWTKTGSSFRVSNFKRHFEAHTETGNDNHVDENIQVLHENQSHIRENTLNQKPREINRLKNYNQMVTLRNIVLSKKNMLLRSEIYNMKRTPMTPLENVISTKKPNVHVQSCSEMNTDFSKLSKENNVLQIRLDASLCEIRRLNDERKSLLDTNLDLSGRIRVFCRLRPTLMSDVEMEKIEYNVLAEEKLEISKTFFLKICRCVC